MMLTPNRPQPRLANAVPGGLAAGIVLAVGAALISGLAIYLNAFAVKQLPDAAVYTTLKNAVAATFLILLALPFGVVRDIRLISRRSWPTVIAVGVLGGGIPFILFFVGLAQASAPSAAFIQKTLFVWVALLAVPFLGERLGLVSIGALGVMLVGQAVILPPTGLRWGLGETLILVATLLWSLETILVKRLLGSIAPKAMAVLRMGIGLIVLVGYLGLTNKLSIVVGLNTGQWAWALLTGLVLAGYVATWFAALRRAPASVVASVLVLGAVVTGALTAVSKGSVPNPGVVAGYVLIVVAAAAIAGWTLRVARRGSSAIGERQAAGAGAD